MTTAQEQYRSLVAKLEAINPSYPVNEADEQEQEYIACIVHHDRSGAAKVQRTKPVSHSRAQEIIKHAVAKSTFKHPPFMTIYPASLGRLDASAIMAQYPDMSQEEVNEADDDFVSTQADGPTGTTTQGTDTTPAGVESPDILKQIEHAPTFKQAYAMAAKAGLKKFKWCQCKEYLVKDKPVTPDRPPNIAPQPKKPGTIPYGNANVIDPEGKYNVPDNPSGWRQAGLASMI
jgi:hypothetical protein